MKLKHISIQELMASTKIVLGAIFIASFYLSAALAFPPDHHEGAYPVGNAPISKSFSRLLQVHMPTS